jgi:hypothetical protein
VGEADGLAPVGIAVGDLRRRLRVGEILGGDPQPRGLRLHACGCDLERGFEVHDVLSI